MLNVGYLSFGARLNCLNRIAVESPFSRNRMTCFAVIYEAKMQHVSVNVTAEACLRNSESARTYNQMDIHEYQAKEILANLKMSMILP